MEISSGVQIIHDGKEYNIKFESGQPPTIIEVKKEEPKMSIFDYCKKNRVWAAMDQNGKWYCYDKSNKLYANGTQWWRKPSKSGYFSSYMHKLDLSKFLPFSWIGDWTNTLITPNGEWYNNVKQRKENKKKAKEFLGSLNGMSGTITMKIIDEVDGKYFVTFLDGQTFKPEKKPELKRGDPIFVWDDESSDEIPAPVHYYYNDRELGVKVYSVTTKNIPGGRWDHYRRFDPKLVGVPRKDWPKEE